MAINPLHDWLKGLFAVLDNDDAAVLPIGLLSSRSIVVTIRGVTVVIWEAVFSTSAPAAGGRTLKRRARYFRLARYLINAKVPRARTMIARIDTSPIPSILEPPVIPSMLMRLCLAMQSVRHEARLPQAAKSMASVGAYISAQALLPVAGVRRTFIS
jgi:hypothetical protein